MNSKIIFIADENVGKLTKQLRLLGFDTTFFTGQQDSQMVNIALKENRMILTRDTHILKRRLITSGRVKAVMIKSDDINDQIRQVVSELKLQNLIKPFTLCLECNCLLERQTSEGVTNRVPPYVWQTQREYMECSQCHRIYWKGTHWEAMRIKLEKLVRDTEDSKP
jgi:uncharacterized protein